MEEKLNKNDIIDAFSCTEVDGHTRTPFAYIAYHLDTLKPGTNPEVLYEKLNQMTKDGMIYFDGQYYSLADTHNSELKVANHLASIFCNEKDIFKLPKIRYYDVGLSQKELNAVNFAGIYHVSLIIGGPGTGKSTLANIIANTYQKNAKNVILSAVTDNGTGQLQALGGDPRPLQAILSSQAIDWRDVELVIVDEAELMTSASLDILLSKLSDSCHLVLLGARTAPFHLGAGNTVDDLHCLGLPMTHLKAICRPYVPHTALNHNMKKFKKIKNIEDFRQDNSFQIHLLEEGDDGVEAVCKDAHAPFFLDENAQILCPNETLRNTINETIQNNLPRYIAPYGGNLFQGDRIVARETDLTQEVYAGDIGRISFPHPKESIAVFYFPGNRLIIYNNKEWEESKFQLGYAISIEQAYGKEFPTVFLVLDDDNPLMNRDMLHTALSRGTECIHIYASRKSLTDALTRTSATPITKLVEETTTEVLAR